MIPTEDLEEMETRLAPLWPRAAGARIFMTGGTGLIGRWMLEALAYSGSDAHVTVLSRDPAAFARRAPHLAKRFELIAGDVLAFAAPPGDFTHVIHAATDASAALNAHDPRRMFDTIVTGTRRTLDLAVARGARRFFFLSSGAVYGPQPSSVAHVAEDWPGGPDPRDPRSAYGEGKRAAEMLCAISAKQHGLAVATARIFALLGPLLSLDIHFAAGNFIRDAIAGRTIEVQGSGGVVRSYLYLADLTVWLWSLFLLDATGTYNVGSEDALTVRELAHRVARLLGSPGVSVLGQADAGWNPGRYVPSTAAIRRDLGLDARIGLDEAIRRTARANGWTP